MELDAKAIADMAAERLKKKRPKSRLICSICRSPLEFFGKQNKGARYRCRFCDLEYEEGDLRIQKLDVCGNMVRIINA